MSLHTHICVCAHSVCAYVIIQTHTIAHIHNYPLTFSLSSSTCNNYPLILSLLHHAHTQTLSTTPPPSNPTSPSSAIHMTQTQTTTITYSLPAKLVDFRGELLVILTDLGDLCPCLILRPWVYLPSQVQAIPQRL